MFIVVFENEHNNSENNHTAFISDLKQAQPEKKTG